MFAICLDPPFTSQRLYHAPLGSKAAHASFDDTWSMSDFAAEWAELQQAADTSLHHTVLGAGLTAGESMQAYLTFMAQRFIELHRVLKPTGSLYLHCDDNASQCLKQLLDAVFGTARFENEIIWQREIGTKNSAKRYPRNYRPAVLLRQV
ncbi:DNA methyltransferase [Candidatus Poriferisodalis sp.]|uniref:DNA methyltransferase n=1 Tax=Candidatus Poriferisodalis sp. TaxID=3101277 RepID=UPI003B02A90B